MSDLRNGVPTVMRVQDAELLAFIEEFKTKHGFAPTVREISAATGLTSTASIAYRLNALEDKGKLSRRPKKARTLTVTFELK